MVEKKNNRRQWGRWLKWLVLLLVLGGGGGYGYMHFTKEKPAATYATIQAKRGTLVDKLAETGTIELTRTVEVKSTISGEIRKLEVEAGDWVKEGQILAMIEPDPNQSLQLYQKRSSVEQAAINLDEQQKDYNRQKMLFERKMVSSKNFEDAEMRLVRARNNLRLAKLELELLETKANLSSNAKGELMLDEVRVEAPIGGIVIRRGVEMGEVVASGLSAMSGGTILFEIGDPSQMIVRGDIAEVDIGKLHAGQEVEIVVDAFPDTVYRGQVRWIAPVGQKKQGSTIVTFDTEVDILDKEPLLRQGMSCDLDIIFSRRDSALYLPPEAIVEIFDEDQEEGRKKAKGRFVVYFAPPADSTTADSLAATELGEPLALITNEAHAASSTPDSLDAKNAKKEEPERILLDRFVELEVQVGLETSTRIELVGGLTADMHVATDAEVVRRAIEVGKHKANAQDGEGVADR